jgi:hypothetical protein
VPLALLARITACLMHILAQYVRLSLLSTLRF